MASEETKYPTENPTADARKAARKAAALAGAKAREAREEATMRAVVDNGARWASNMLVEIVSNYGRDLPTKKREHLRAACRSLADASSVRWPVSPAGAERREEADRG